MKHLFALKHVFTVLETLKTLANDDMTEQTLNHVCRKIREMISNLHSHEILTSTPCLQIFKFLVFLLFLMSKLRTANV